MHIPKIIHRVWIGPDPLPEEHVRFGETFRNNHPGWEMRLWTNKEVENLPLHAEVALTVPQLSSRSNVYRLVILFMFGGVYVDTDVESLKPLDILLENVTAFAGEEGPGVVCNGVMGALPKHPWIKWQVERLSQFCVMEPPWGPYLTTLASLAVPVAIFPQNIFHPLHWTETGKTSEKDFDRAYMIHRYARNWKSAA